MERVEPIPGRAMSDDTRKAQQLRGVIVDAHRQLILIQKKIERRSRSSRVQAFVTSVGCPLRCVVGLDGNYYVEVSGILKVWNCPSVRQVKQEIRLAIQGRSEVLRRLNRDLRVLHRLAKKMGI